MQIICPDCDVELPIPDNAYPGQIIDCHNCGAEIQITNLEPIEYELVEDEK